MCGGVSHITPDGVRRTATPAPTEQGKRAMSLCRITGTVLGVDTREGVSDKGAWKMRSARVLVAGEDVTVVGLPDKMQDPDRLDPVDLLCRVRKSGNFLNIDAVSPWSPAHDAASV